MGVLLIILGGIDLGKAIVATDESGIKKAKKKLINKFVAAACIFLVLSVIQMIVNITGGGNYGNLDSSNKNCLYYLNMDMNLKENIFLFVKIIFEGEK